MLQGNGPSQECIKATILQHLGSARQFSVEGQYSRLIIQANRIITDSVLFCKDGECNQNQVLCGLVLRLAHIEADLGKDPKTGNLLMPQKSAITKLIDELIESVKNPTLVTNIRIWEIYDAFFRDFWNDVRSRADGPSYDSNPELVSEAIAWSFSRVNEWQSLIVDGRGAPLAGIGNELMRIVRAHGCNQRDHMFIGLLLSFGWCYDFVKWGAVKDDSTVDNEVLKSVLGGFLERISRLSQEDDEMLYSTVGNIIVDVLKLWRESFVKYFDLHLSQEASRRVIIHPQEKKRPPIHAKRKGMRDDEQS